MIFPNAQEEKRNRGTGHEELGTARNFGFRFPAEKLDGEEKSKKRPTAERNDFDVAAGGRGGMDNGLLQCVYEIGGWKEEPDALNGDV